MVRRDKKKLQGTANAHTWRLKDVATPTADLYGRAQMSSMPATPSLSYWLRRGGVLRSGPGPRFSEPNIPTSSAAYGRSTALWNLRRDERREEELKKLMEEAERKRSHDLD